MAPVLIPGADAGPPLKLSPFSSIGDQCRASNFASASFKASRGVLARVLP
jgi:hypothetical protein